jgi:hypothetical protein
MAPVMFNYSVVWTKNTEMTEKKAVQVACKYEGGATNGGIVSQFLSLATEGSAQI